MIAATWWLWFQLDPVQRGEETPMECDAQGAEWDIRNEFETINGMPVYYGGDLCDSDGTLHMQNMWISTTLMLWRGWN